MKAHKYLNHAQRLRSTKIEIFYSLAEKYGSPFHTGSEERQSPEQQMNFQLDRLFTVFHHN